MDVSNANFNKEDLEQLCLFRDTVLKKIKYLNISEGKYKSRKDLDCLFSNAKRFSSLE